MTEPTNEHMEVAGKIYNEIFEAGGDVQLEIARLLAQRDEKVRAEAIDAAQQEIIEMLERRSTDAYFANELAHKSIVGWLRDFQTEDRARFSTPKPEPVTDKAKP